MTYEWLHHRLDTDRAVFGPQEEVLLTLSQRREVVLLFYKDLRFVPVRPVGRALLVMGLPVRVPAPGGGHMGGVRA